MADHPYPGVKRLAGRSTPNFACWPVLRNTPGDPGALGAGSDRRQRRWATFANTIRAFGSLLSLLRKLGVLKEQAAIHGFRSVIRDWCGEETDHDATSASGVVA